MPPFAPSSAPSRPSHRFRNVSYFQYRLSTFLPDAGSVRTSRPQTTPTFGSRNHRTRFRIAPGSVNVFASESITTSPRSSGIDSFRTVALPRRSGYSSSRTPRSAYRRTIVAVPSLHPSVATTISSRPAG